MNPEIPVHRSLGEGGRGQIPLVAALPRWGYPAVLAGARFTEEAAGWTAMTSPRKKRKSSEKRRNRELREIRESPSGLGKGSRFFEYLACFGSTNSLGEDLEIDQGSILKALL